MRKLLPILLTLLLLPLICASETPDTLITLRDRDSAPLLTCLPDADISLWHDVTPPALDGMSWRIYRNAESCSALLLTEDGLFPLGESFGGFGVTSAAPCAAADGAPGLLLTYSWGSGMHRSILAFFRPDTQQLIELATHWPTGDEPGELILLPPTLRTDSPLSSYAVAEYPVWLADACWSWRAGLADLTITPAVPAGTVTEDHGLHVELDLGCWPS